MGVATLVPGMGRVHRRHMLRFAYTGALTAMLHDHTRGTVRPDGDLGVSIDYWPDAADRAELALGLARCGELLFAAGARRVFVPGHPTPTIHRGSDPRQLALTRIERGRVDISAVHPMASVPMGDDPREAAVDSRGRHHHLDGLWISDGSLLCSSIGVPPQLSIYALGLHVGADIIRG
jgi:choline dehydrogenase-like flavoprotein